MQHGQLLSHADTDLVTRDQLRALSTPEPTATFRPVPHVELVDTLDLVLQQNQIRIREEQFAVRRDGSMLFGVLELAYGESTDGTAALGLRTANNKTMAIQICAGLKILVCSNLAFRGDMIALRRKHTSGLLLREELAGAVLRFQDHFGQLTGEIENLKERLLTDVSAKAIIHDVFARGILPLRLLPEASNLYFEPFVDEFRPRNAWSLHNAFTAAAKEMPITTRMPAIQELGRLFGMSADPNAPAHPVLEAA